jgi:2-methylisocitrate lyase-like PEP mutase family enzyme
MSRRRFSVHSYADQRTAVASRSKTRKGSSAGGKYRHRGDLCTIKTQLIEFLRSLPLEVAVFGVMGAVNPMVDGKTVIEPKEMVNKIRAACSARRDAEQLFIIARTDAIAVNGVDDALRRGEMYLKAGADGVYVEGPCNLKELQAVGRAFKGEPLVVTMLEGGGVTPWASPQEFYGLGFNMILYPTTLLFRQTRAVQRALVDLKAGRPMPKDDSVTMTEFEKVVDIAYWKATEEKPRAAGRTNAAGNK